MHVIENIFRQKESAVTLSFLIRLHKIFYKKFQKFQKSQ